MAVLTWVEMRPRPEILINSGMRVVGLADQAQQE
jgi:hypothetical protein